MPKQPTPPARSPEAKMRDLARKHVARYGWPAGEFALNRLIEALQDAVPKQRPREVMQASGTVAGRRGRVAASAARPGPAAASGTQAASAPATAPSEPSARTGGAR